MDQIDVWFTFDVLDLIVLATNLCRHIKVVTIGQVYINAADCTHYKLLFDEVQKAVQSFMSCPPRFKRLSPDGNILALNVDLEAAQVLRAGNSFMPTNVPEYSGIDTEDPAELVEYFTKACHTHVKRCVVYIPL